MKNTVATTATKTPHYAELVCCSNFSFLSGASHPQELVARAAELGYRAIAITDECSLAGVVRALEEQRRCRDSGLAIQLIPGSLFRLHNGSRLVLLPQDHDGYAQLCTLITRGRRNAPKGEYALPDKTFEHGLDRCLAIWLPADEKDLLTAHWLAGFFPGRCWLGVSLHLGADDAQGLGKLSQLARTAGIPLAACGDVQMHQRSRRMLHDVLAAIRHGCTVAELGYRALPCGERHLHTRQQLQQRYPAELLAATLDIAGRCNFRLEQLHYRYPREVVPAGHDASSHLRQLTEAGILERWPQGISTAVREQIEKELVLIAELHYESYFLTVYDIVRFAKSQGILCQGRGSAANSAVCYCLGITEVDPARMNMLFERFISRERDEPPDIDVDFEHERREEVIQYIYRKYGRDRAALAATVISYRPRSAIRDVARALGFSLGQADLLARNTAWWDQPESFSQRIAEQGFKLDNLKVQHLVYLVQSIVGFPRHLSQHVGGFVISEAPLASLVPVENAAMPDRTVIQWDKEDLETLGLLKVDCLALGMLSAIHRCLDLIQDNWAQNDNWGQSKNSSLPQGSSQSPSFYSDPKFNSSSASFYSDPCLANIPAEDPATYAMIQKADTVGVFQIESRAQMAMLPRLKPACFYDLVIEVAIVRPGPIQGNMVHPFLQRRRGLEQVNYPSAALKAVLERTLGVPIFQEQVMQIAMVAAGFSGSEADALRRSMAAWARRGGLEHMHQRLVSGMLERGYSESFAEQIFQQIRGFGEYGFPESHAASFALLVYVSAWLKCHYPAAFTCALLNSQPMGFYQPAQLVQDAQRHGVKVLPADVRYSDWECSLEGPALRLGLRMIKGMREAAAQRLVKARQQGLFRQVQDLATRAALDRHDLAVLAESGALRGLAGHRHRARWEVAAVEQQAVFPLALETDHSAESVSIRPPTEVDDMRTDYASSGLTLGRHPVALLRSQLRRRRAKPASELQRLPHGSRVRACGLVTMRQRPMTASGTLFLTLEDETGCVNVVIWPRLWEKQRAEILGASVLAIDGVMETDGEVHHLIASRAHDFSHLADGLQTRSRDFH
ncbi:MAG: error-prone DNA polymerase [Xanthomonadales bacterium]|nr:error-prone DNA polymerase [Xanthomonadales bacterium]